MAQYNHTFGLCTSRPIVIVLCCIAALCVAGCGNDPGGGLFGMPLVMVECDGRSGSERAALDVVVLDWSGGTSALYPDDYFDGLEFFKFKTLGGGTLADDVEAFKEAVRQEVTRILCDIPEVSVRVESAGQYLPYDVTTVQFAQVFSPHGPGQIGRGEYDPCNLQHDDVAIIFGEELLRLGGPFTFDEWVLMFANVAAHEIGHTLGFGHVERQDSPDAERSRYVELMLAVHTVDEMIREQRLLADATNCPTDDSPATLRRITETDMVCGVAEE